MKKAQGVPIGQGGCFFFNLFVYLIVAGFGEQLSLYDVTQMNGYRVPRTVTGHRVPLEKEANHTDTWGMGMFISGNLNTKKWKSQKKDTKQVP